MIVSYFHDGLNEANVYKQILQVTIYVKKNTSRACSAVIFLRTIDQGLIVSISIVFDKVLSNKNIGELITEFEQNLCVCLKRFYHIINHVFNVIQL